MSLIDPNKALTTWETGDVIKSNRLNNIQAAITNIDQYLDLIQFTDSNGNISTATGNVAVATTGYITNIIDTLKNSDFPLMGDLQIGNSTTSKNAQIYGDLTVSETTTLNNAEITNSIIVGNDGNTSIIQDSITKLLTEHVIIGKDNNTPIAENTITNIFGTINLYGTLDIQNNTIPWSKISNIPNFTPSGRDYAVQFDNSKAMYVNVPWENTTYSAATNSTLGLIKVGNNLSIDANGILSATDTTYAAATTTTLGLIKVGNNLSIDENGVLSSIPISYSAATTDTLGLIKVGDNMSIGVDGTLTIPDIYTVNKPLYDIYAQNLTIGRVTYSNGEFTTTGGNLTAFGSATIGNNGQYDYLLVQGQFGIKDGTQTVYLTASELAAIKTACNIT